MGATDWELRTRPWIRPFRGIVREFDDADNPLIRIGDAIALMSPTDVLTGWAAAYLHGVTVLDGRDRHFRESPIVVGSPAVGQHRPRPGIVPTRRSFHEWEVEELGGTRVATLSRAAYDLALDAPSLEEAMVAFDMCTSTVIRQSRTTVANIGAVIESHVKTRGIVRARNAIRLSSSRSASPWETRTRFVAEQLAGITDLTVNVPIFGRGGDLVGVADLLQEEDGLVIESDGSGHREERPHSEDNIREEAFESLGLVVARATSIDHRRRQELGGRLASARLQARMNRNPRRWSTQTPDWWPTWHPGRRWD